MDGKLPNIYKKMPNNSLIRTQVGSGWHQFIEQKQILIKDVLYD
jgi:hypothetical protein